LQGLLEALAALFHARRRTLLALSLGVDHLDDLPPPGDPIGGRVAADPGDHRGIDRIGFRSLAQRIGEGAHLRRIDHHDRQSRRAETGRHHALEAARGRHRIFCPSDPILA
jgi:hypothetical protein